MILNGIYGLIMLFGLWSIAFIVFKKNDTKTNFYIDILPTNIAFWLFVTIPLLTYIFMPDIPRAIIVLELHLISILFLVVIPIMIQKLLNRICYINLWHCLAGIIAMLFLISWFNSTVVIYVKVLYIFVYSIFFVFFTYIRFTTPHKSSNEITYLNRFFYSTILFLPGILMDITGISEHYLKGFYCTPWFYLVTASIVFTLPKEEKIESTKINFQKLANDYKLTQREVEIIPLVLAGKSNQVIANELHITVSTVKRHIHHIFQKTNVKNRFELARKLNP